MYLNIVSNRLHCLWASFMVQNINFSKKNNRKPISQHPGLATSLHHVQAAFISYPPALAPGGTRAEVSGSLQRSAPLMSHVLDRPSVSGAKSAVLDRPAPQLQHQYAYIW